MESVDNFGVQITEQAVEEALSALRASHPPVIGPKHPRMRSAPMPAIEGARRAPTLRMEEIDRARKWLGEGRSRDGAELARAVVGRLVCERVH